jgi:hypothetical protein
VDVTDRIVCIAGAATAVAVVEVVWPLLPLIRLTARAAVLALILGLILGPMTSAGDPPAITIGRLCATAALGALAWINLWALEERDRGTAAGHGLIITSGGASPVLLLSGSVILGLLGTVLTSALLAARLAGGDRSAAGLVVGSAVLTALVLEGYVYASLSTFSALLLAAALAGAWISSSETRRRQRDPLVSILSTLATLLPLSVAIGCAAFSHGPRE